MAEWDDIASGADRGIPAFLGMIKRHEENGTLKSFVAVFEVASTDDPRNHIIEVFSSEETSMIQALGLSSYLNSVSKNMIFTGSVEPEES